MTASTRRTREEAALWLASVLQFQMFTSAPKGEYVSREDIAAALLALTAPEADNITNPSVPMRDGAADGGGHAPQTPGQTGPGSPTCRVCNGAQAFDNFTGKGVSCVACTPPPAPGKVEEAIDALVKGAQYGGVHFPRAALLAAIEADKAAEVEHRNAESHHFALACQTRAESAERERDEARREPDYGMAFDAYYRSWPRNPDESHQAHIERFVRAIIDAALRGSK